MKILNFKKIVSLALVLAFVILGGGFAYKAFATATSVTITKPTTALPVYVRTNQPITVTSTLVLTTSSQNVDLQISIFNGASSTTSSVTIATSSITSTTMTFSTSTTITLGTEGTYNLMLGIRQPGGSGTYVTSSVQTSAVVVDNTANAPVISSVATDGYINNSEKSTVSIVGTAEASSTVTVTLYNGASSTVAATAVATSGAWAVSVNTSSTLADGTITVSSTIVDLAGNTSAAATTTATKDTVAPIAPVFTTVGGADQIIGFAEKAAAHAVGTAESGSTVTVTLYDASSTAATATGTATGGNFDISVNASSLNDGAITASSTATDVAGNVGAAVTTSTVTKDTAVPSLTTVAASGVTRTSATLNGNLSSIHGDAVTDFGFKYNTGSGPLVTISLGAGTLGAFQTSLGQNNFSCDQTYSFYAYATNAAGTNNGSTLTWNGACSNTSGSSGGGGGGGGGTYIPPAPTPTPTPTPIGSSAVSDIQAQLNAAIAQLNALLAAQGKPTYSGGGSFSRNITLGSARGEDVRSLQQYLNGHGFQIAASGPGSTGNETTLFGRATRAALMKFQASIGLPATGYFGSMTRNYISSH